MRRVVITLIAADSHVRAARAAGPGRLAHGVRLGERPPAPPSRHLRPWPRALAAPAGLPDELERQLLAREPPSPAHRVRPDHRDGGHGPDPADPDRVGHGPALDRRDRPPRAARLHPRRNAAHGVQRRVLRRDDHEARSCRCAGSSRRPAGPDLERSTRAGGALLRRAGRLERQGEPGVRGAVLSGGSGTTRTGPRRSPYSHPFDPDHPVTTPYGLDTSNPQVQQAFGDALGDLDAANAPFDAALGTPLFIVKTGCGSRSTVAPATPTATSTPCGRAGCRATA